MIHPTYRLLAQICFLIGLVLCVHSLNQADCRVETLTNQLAAVSAQRDAAVARVAVLEADLPPPIVQFHPSHFTPAPNRYWPPVKDAPAR